MSLEYINTFKDKGPKGYDLVDLLTKAVSYWRHKAAEAGFVAVAIDGNRAVGHQGRGDKFIRVCKKIGIMKTGIAEDDYFGKNYFTQDFINKILADIPEPKWEFGNTLVGGSEELRKIVRSSDFLKERSTASLGSYSSGSGFENKEVLRDLYYLGHLSDFTRMSYTTQYSHGMNREEDEIIPTKFIAKAKYLEIRALSLKLIQEKASFVCREMFGLPYVQQDIKSKYSRYTPYDVNITVDEDFIEDIIKKEEKATSVHFRKTIKALEDRIIVIDFFTKYQEGLTEEQVNDKLVDDFLVYLANKAALLLHDEGLLGYLARQFLAGNIVKPQES